MTIPDSTVGVLVVVALVAIVALAAAVGVLVLRLRALRRAYASALGSGRDEDVFEALARYRSELGEMRRDVATVNDEVQHVRDLVRGGLSRVGVVRYDAFDDMGGALSFSTALLDERGDGVVISTINARTEARTYAKPIARGSSEHNLSPEEDAAIDAAMTGEKRSTVPSTRRRGRSSL